MMSRDLFLLLCTAGTSDVTLKLAQATVDTPGINRSQPVCTAHILSV